jgi:hypothetical protein
MEANVMLKKLLFKAMLVLFVFLSLPHASTAQGTILNLSCAYYTVGGTEYLCCQYFVWVPEAREWFPLGDPAWKEVPPLP